TLNLLGHGVGRSKQALMDVYAKDGTLPQDTATKLQAQPPVKAPTEGSLKPVIRVGPGAQGGVLVGDVGEGHAELAERLYVKPTSLDELNADPKLADRV